MPIVYQYRKAAVIFKIGILIYNLRNATQAGQLMGIPAIPSGKRPGSASFRQKPLQEKRCAVGKRQDAIGPADVSAVELDSPRDVFVFVGLDQGPHALRVSGFRLHFDGDKMTRRADEEVLLQRGVVLLEVDEVIGIPTFAIIPSRPGKVQRKRKKGCDQSLSSAQEAREEVRVDACWKCGMPERGRPVRHALPTEGAHRQGNQPIRPRP